MFPSARLEGKIIVIGYSQRGLDMRTLSLICLILMVVGALNWGLVALFGLDLVAALFGTSLAAKIIYLAVGVAGVYGIFMIVRLATATDDICVPSHRPTATGHA